MISAVYGIYITWCYLPLLAGLVLLTGKINTQKATSSFFFFSTIMEHGVRICAEMMCILVVTINNNRPVQFQRQVLGIQPQKRCTINYLVH